MRQLLLCSLLSLLCTCVLAQSEKATDWTVDDILKTESMRSVQFSPDGDMVLWSKRRAVTKKDRFVSDLYLTRLVDKKDGKYRTIRLTQGDESEYSAFFSKDGEYVYFLSSREKGNKLWRMSLYGGEPEQVHEFKNGISSPQWIDSTTLAFVSFEGKDLVQQELEKKKDNVVVVEDTASWKINRLYQLDLKTKKISRITMDEKPVRGYTLSKDGKMMAYWLAGSPHQPADAQPKSTYFLRDMESGETRQILEGYQTPRSIQFTDDRAGLYFMAVSSSDPEWDGAGMSEVYYMNLSDYSIQKVNLDWELGVGGGMTVMGSDFHASLANRATRREAYYQKTPTGWTKTDIDLGKMKDHVSMLAVSDDHKRVILEHSVSSQLPKFYVANFNGTAISDEEEVVQLNGKLKKKRITKSEVVEWKGWNDEMVTGILYYPEDYEEGRAYPLMLSIHGGPSGVDLDRWSERWSTYPQMLAQRGSFVLKPNYHGSSNHGQAFVESIKLNYYEPEMEDIMNGVNWLIERGMVHEDSIGTMGWSNGAILTTMLTVRFPEVFKVACPGAGDVNWTSDYGTCRFGVSFDQSYFGGAPWDNIGGKTYNENYILKSPLFELERVTTPTIIFHGSEDRAVPRDQGWEYYRALQQIKKAPVRFLWFPGQPHGLGKITHQQRKMNEELQWIDTYLFGKADTKNKTFKKDSPLAMLLAKDSLARVGDFFGRQVRGKLLPEVVSLGKDTISLGRFEVTNAQYASYDREHRYGANAGNHPARVTRPQAKLYLDWLSKQLGKTARLPNKKEAEALHKKARTAGPKENTLNYWAGYAITVDEVPEFLMKMEEAEMSLFKAVGSFTPVKVGKANVYDLGGNVAEYAQDGGRYGYGAYDFVDPSADNPGGMKAMGFRVVVE
jgi:dipeptidyl aminopeptidase/acylaminoacyl peptidase